MPLIFVHGIGNRRGPRYDAACRARNGLFERFLLREIFGDRADAQIVSPYWGDHAAKLRWNGVSGSTDGFERFGHDVDAVRAVAELLRASGDASVLATAMRSLPDAVDLIYTSMREESLVDAALDLAHDIVGYQLYRESIMPGVSEVERYPWLREIGDDLAFLDRLLDEVRRWTATPVFEVLGDSTQGARDRLAAGVSALRRAGVAAATSPIATALRSGAGQRVTLLLGDVLAYLGRRGERSAPGPIVAVVAEAIDAAVSAARPGEPLLVVGHSMGQTAMTS